MKGKAVVWGGVGLLVAGGAAVAAWLFLARPATPEAQLERARKVEAANRVKIAGLKAAGTPDDLRHAARLRGQIAAEYAAVKARFPEAAAAVEEADYALLQMNDEEATSPEIRLRLIRDFLDVHTTSSRAADLRWKAAQITDKELRKPLEAIRTYEDFARDFPKDGRAPEALFRVGAIYEEIREYPRAVEAYRRVVKDYPKSPLAEQAQFRVGTLLADRMEKKQEAAQEFEKLEKQFPKSRLAGAAAGERRKLAAAAKKSEAEQARDDYYGGVREVDVAQRMAEAAESPQMQRIRAQQTDLVHTDLRMELAPADGRLTATAAMRIATRAAAPGTTGSLGMQLAPSFNVVSVTREGQEAKYKAEDGYLFVELDDRPLAPGTTETFVVTYTGRNPETMVGEITSGSTHLINHFYLPQLDYGDSFTGEYWITVPEGYYASTQGERVEETTDTQGRITWRTRQTVPVWNHALAAAPYVVTTSEYRSRATSVTVTAGEEARETERVIPLTVCLFPDTTPTLARRYLEELPRILAFFETHLGPYPYSKLTVAQVQSFPGGLGSPGLILIGPAGFTEGDAPAQFLAHEVAHAWFGNLLTLDLSPGSIPWLSEGFAQYWDALYHEHLEGAPALARLMRSRAESYYEALSQVDDQPLSETRFRDPIYAPLTYEKGAFVLHALRGVMGDKRFFRMMRDYVDEHAGRVVRMDDLRRAADRAAGEPLGWFFDQWVDQPGMPRYRINRAYQAAASGPPFRTEVEVEQVGRLFRMPVDVELMTADGDPVRQRVTIEEALTTVTLTSDQEPVKVILDPDYRILKHPRREETEKAVTRD